MRVDDLARQHEPTNDHHRLSPTPNESRRGGLQPPSAQGPRTAGEASRKSGGAVAQIPAPYIDQEKHHAHQVTARPRARGRAFWRDTAAGFYLERGELELLAEVCRTLDEIDALAAAIARDGPTVPGSAGQTRTHPAINEVRQHRLALGRLLAQLALPDLDGASIPKPTSLRASHAARTRWGRRGDGAA